MNTETREKKEKTSDKEEQHVQRQQVEAAQTDITSCSHAAKKFILFPPTGGGGDIK